MNFVMILKQIKPLNQIIQICLKGNYYNYVKFETNEILLIASPRKPSFTAKNIDFVAKVSLIHIALNTA